LLSYLYGDFHSLNLPTLPKFVYSYFDSIAIMDQDSPIETSYTVPLWINGKEETRASTFKVTSPITNEVCWTGSIASLQDLEEAITSAATAFKTWRHTKPLERQAILMKAADHFGKKRNEYGEYLCTEMGTERRAVYELEIPLVIDMMWDIATRISSVVASAPITQGEGRSAIVWKEPYGVVFVSGVAAS